MNLNLRNARNRLGLTQSDVARVLHTSQQTYLRYETKGRIPNAKRANRIARALNSTSEELFGF